MEVVYGSFVQRALGMKLYADLLLLKGGVEPSWALSERVCFWAENLKTGWHNL